MNQVRAIRERLGVTQTTLASAVGCSQSNVSFYENGQEVPPQVAKSLINFAATRGVSISFDHIYGNAELPPLVVDAAAAEEGANA